MSGQWYYKILGVEFGPVPLELLAELSRSGHLPDDAEIRPHFESYWTIASSVGRLPNLVSQTAPPVARAAVDSSALKSAIDRLPPADLWPAIAAAATAQVNRVGADGPTPARRFHVRAPNGESPSMSLADLKSLVRKGELSGADEVRPAESRVWIRVENLEELGPELIAHQQALIDQLLIDSASTRGGPQPARVALPLPQLEQESPEVRQPETRRTKRRMRPDPELAGWVKAPPDDYGTPPAASAPNVRNTVTNSTGPTAAAAPQQPGRRLPNKPLPARFQPPRERRPRAFAVKLALSGVTLSSLLGFLIYCHLNKPTDQQYFETINTVWNEFQEVQKPDVPSIDRLEFARQSSEKLTAIVRDLEKTSNSHTPARQNMLWAARDYLSPMLEPLLSATGHTTSNRQKAYEDPKTVEARFKEQMQTAERLLRRG